MIHLDIIALKDLKCNKIFNYTNSCQLHIFSLITISLINLCLLYKFFMIQKRDIRTDQDYILNNRIVKPMLNIKVWRT